jgi:hypothetical protein
VGRRDGGPTRFRALATLRQPTAVDRAGGIARGSNGYGDDPSLDVSGLFRIILGSLGRRAS